VKRKLVPSYVLHKQSGRGRLLWTDAAGIRQQKLLPGPFNSPESLVAKARLELEIATAATAPPTRSPTDAVSVAEALGAFLEHAKQHYRRDDGTPTRELRDYKFIIRHVRELYGETRAANFGPLALKAMRQKFIGAGWCRSLINQRVGRIVRVFKWAVGEELVPPAVHQGLAAVGGLQRGRTDAPDHDPVGPVEDAVIDATLPRLNRHVRGLVEFQRLTGCRPGEACRVRRCDIDAGPSGCTRRAGTRTPTAASPALSPSGRRRRRCCGSSSSPTSKPTYLARGGLLRRCGPPGPPPARRPGGSPISTATLPSG
jgi:integrase